MKDKIVIVHIFTDSQFFDSVSNYFESFDGIENRFYFYTKKKNFEFTYIKNKDKIQIVDNFADYLSLLNATDVDIIYLQSMTKTCWNYIPRLRKEIKVIWWCFGTEIYDPDFMDPVIKIELYKPLTKVAKIKSTPIYKHLWRKILILWNNIVFSRQRRNAIERVDYFSPVLPIEYDIMKEQCPYFRAKPFMLQCGPTDLINIPLVVKEKVGDVLVGNSCSYTNNHLDMFDALKNVSLEGNRHFIFPVSYGWAYGSPAKLKKLCRLAPKSCIWLDSFIPYNEYQKLFNNVTHAVFGVIRQQSIGNIALCLREGIKVYLFKESLVYKYFKGEGYVVFSIEDDLNQESLSKCLTKSESIINQQLSIKRYSATSIVEVERELRNIIK